MIGKLTGILDEIGEDHCVVDVNGVGYVAYCSARTLAACRAPATRSRCSSRPMCART